jgi:hypothetical protein
MEDEMSRALSASSALTLQNALASVTDEALVSDLRRLVRDDQALEAQLLAHIGEVDARRLYARFAAPSMFQYCVCELHLSEAEAYRRITVARAVRKYPLFLDRIAQGELNLSTGCLLCPHLTEENHAELFTAAKHRSKREVERLLATRFPKRAVPDRVRKLPVSRTSESLLIGENRTAETADDDTFRRLAESETDTGAKLPASDVQPPAPDSHPPNVGAKGDGVVEPLNAAQYRVEFTASATLEEKPTRAGELLGFSVSPNDLATIVERGIDLLIKDLENKKHGVCTRPRPEPAQTTESVDGNGGMDESRAAKVGAGRETSGGRGSASDSSRAEKPPSKKSRRAPGMKRSRTIGRGIRREVYARDQGQCVYRDGRGKRCLERRGLHYHHRRPFAVGGDATVDNIELRCATHNALSAEEDFGRDATRRFRRDDSKN